jgi:plasmid stabilization system protein ParE
VGWPQENLTAADRAARAIYDGMISLATFPNQGRTWQNGGYSGVGIVPLPYVVVDRVKDEVVEIARVLHGAQP